MKRKLSFALKVATVIAIVVFIIAIFVTSQRQDAIRQDLKTIIAAQELKQSIPHDGKDASIEQITSAVYSYMADNPVKSGHDGHSATDDQVQEVVNNYMRSHPIEKGKTPTKGKDFQDGKTPILRCNVMDNAWEVKYSKEDNWQLLNGESVKCTLGELQ